MKKFFEVVLSILSTLVLAAIVIPLTLSLMLSSPKIQTWAVHHVSSYISEAIGTKISIKNVNVRFFNRVVLNDVYVEDYGADTLMYVGSLDVGLRGYDPASRTLLLKTVVLTSADFFMSQDSSGRSNLSYVIDKIPKSNSPKSGNIFRLKASNVEVKGSHFKYKAFDAPKTPGAVNYGDLDIRNVNLNAQNFSLVGDSISVAIDSLSFFDKSGFKLDLLSARKASMNAQGFQIDKVLIKSGDSKVRMNQMALTGKSMESFDDFVNKVTMSASFRNAVITPSTLGFFVPAIKNIKGIYTLNGDVKGCVNNLKGSFKNFSTLDTDLEMDFSIKGLPDITKTYFSAEIKKLTTNVDDVSEIITNVTDKPFKLPIAGMKKLGVIILSGDFYGLINDFKVDGDLSTDLGKVDYNLLMSPNGIGKNFSGTVGCVDFNLGSLLAVKNLGNVTVYTDAKGTIFDGNFRMNASADIAKLNFNGYNYNNLFFSGDLEKNFFNGSIIGGDPNLNFNFLGTIDLAQAIPEYDFNLSILAADLKMLDINKRDSVSRVSGDMEVKFSGSNIDNINGNAEFSALCYFNGVDTIRVNDINFVARNSEKSKLITMKSGFADIDIRGSNSYNDLFGYLRNTLLTYIPLLSDVNLQGGKNLADKSPVDVSHLVADGDYTIDVNVKESAKVASILVPSLDIAPGSKLRFKFNPYANLYTLSVNSDAVMYDNIIAQGITVESSNVKDSLMLLVKSADFNINKLNFPNLKIAAGARNNALDLTIDFHDSTKKSSAFINTTTLFERKNNLTQLALKFNESWFTMQNNAWYFNSGPIVMDTLGLSVDKFMVLSKDQELLIDGNISSTRNDTLRLDIKNFDIEPFAMLLNSAGYYVKGQLNGKANLVGQKSNMLFYSDLNLNNINVNGIAMQNSTLQTKWSAQNKNLAVELFTSDKKLITGIYHPADKGYLVDVDIDDVDLALLKPVLESVFSEMSGKVDVKARLTGVGDKPKINGKAEIKSFLGKVAFTNVAYSTTGVLNVVDNKLIINKAPVSDGGSGKGELELMVDLNSLKNIKFDIKVLIDKMLALNITAKDNPLFYGKAYASGGVTIKGDRDGVNMDIAATTQGASSFFLPLSNRVQNVSESDFVVFRSSREAVVEQRDSLERRRMIERRKKAQKDSGSTSDLRINIALNVLDNTEVQLVIDPKVGDIIKARGTGRLDLNIIPNKNIFTMSGDYVIDQGSYLFTLSNIINKKFVIERGSTIQWTGDPIDATLDITAIYKVKTSIAPLLNGVGDEQYKRRIPIDCLIKLTDKLSQPSIAFDVTAPNADAETQSIITNALNTPDLKTTQFVWLLAMNSFFVDGSSNVGSNIGSGTTATGLEMISNQISNWFSTDKYNLGFKIRPKDDVAESEIEIGLSTELVSDRLLLEVEGNYGFGDNPKVSKNQASNLTGDFYLTWVLDKSGKIRARLYSRKIDRFDEDQGLQESGLGIYYHDDFDSFKDLLKKKNNKNKRRKVKEN